MESIRKYRPAILALGGNQASPAGPPEATLKAALGRLAAESFGLRAISRFFRTPAFPAGAGPDYVNAVALAETDLGPEAVLAKLHAVEAGFGRQRAARWGTRTLDIDLIALDDLVLPDAGTVRDWIGLDPARQAEAAPDGLLLPHPRVQDRAFVLVPLADVAPLWRHPLTGRTTAEMLAALPQALRAEVVAL